MEIKGSFDPAFQSIVDCFEKQYEIGLDQGSSLAMTCEGELVVDIWAGHRDVAKTKPWEEDTIVNVFSSDFCCDIFIFNDSEANSISFFSLIKSVIV